MVITSGEAYLPLRKMREERLVELQNVFELLSGRDNAAAPTSFLSWVNGPLLESDPQKRVAVTLQDWHISAIQPLGFQLYEVKL